MPASALHKRPLKGAPDRKTVLFCPECDHEGFLDETWIEVDWVDSYEYICPECLNTVIKQPVF